MILKATLQNLDLRIFRDFLEKYSPGFWLRRRDIFLEDCRDGERLNVDLDWSYGKNQEKIQLVTTVTAM